MEEGGGGRRGVLPPRGHILEGPAVALCATSRGLLGRPLNIKLTQLNAI